MFCHYRRIAKGKIVTDSKVLQWHSTEYISFTLKPYQRLEIKVLEWTFNNGIWIQS